MPRNADKGNFGGTKLNLGQGECDLKLSKDDIRGSKTTTRIQNWPIIDNFGFELFRSRFYRGDSLDYDYLNSCGQAAF